MQHGQSVAFTASDLKDLRWYEVKVFNFRRKRWFVGAISPYKLGAVIDALKKRHKSLAVTPSGVEPIVFRMRPVGPIVMVLTALGDKTLH